MANLIPLFPLKLVVFPGSKYPLHIFEPRYKKMINWCLENNSGFGVCSFLNDEISRIGTYVRIDTILRKHENGEMDIIVKGMSRISIIDISIHDDGYHLGNTLDYSDITSAINEKSLSVLKNSFESLISQVDFKLDESFWKSFERTNLKSFKLAEKSGLSLDQQQELITITNENSRIDFLINHLEKLNKEIQEKSVLKKIIAADGYLN
ncbi:MAG: LON peptidase substrate-binding domain-containing protein [Ignavibacteriales bacterium]|nr:MAG: LON peptidase substrate-binding domain-containing protein [Ignavibacteriales bacterium]